MPRPESSSAEDAAGATVAVAAMTSGLTLQDDNHPETTTATHHHRLSRLSEWHTVPFDSYVKSYGWIYGLRTQGAGTLVFLDINDGSMVTPTRCVAAVIAATTTMTTNNEESEPKEVDSNVLYYGTTPSSSSLETEEEELKDYTHLSFDQLMESSQLSLGCSIVLYGKLVRPPVAGTTQQYEIQVSAVHRIGGVIDASKYPIQKSILKKPLALRSLYHARFRAPLIQQLMQIRSQTLFAIHEFFHKEQVPLLDPNIFTASDCEGAGEIFKITPQFFSSSTTTTLTSSTTTTTTTDPTTEVGLTVSSQLPLEAISMGTGAVYTCQKSFRAEKSDTNKHLAEFLHIEYEQYFINFEQLLDQAERYVKTVMRTVLERCAPQYHFLNQNHLAPAEFHGHDQALRQFLEKPFVRIKHADAIALMQQDLRDKVKYINEEGKQVKLKFKEKPEFGHDLGSEHEKYLVQKFQTFVFVTHWPSNIKSFYMKQVGDGTCESFDLLAPHVGELFGGSMREWRYDVLSSVMQERNMDFRPLQWFVDLRRDGTAPHGGWGMGFDRFVMFLTNAASVRDVVPYPVYYGHCPY
jgi:asparaginyl-tRNA synthetase